MSFAHDFSVGLQVEHADCGEPVNRRQGCTDSGHRGNTRSGEQLFTENIYMRDFPSSPLSSVPDNFEDRHAEDSDLETKPAKGYIKKAQAKSKSSNVSQLPATPTATSKMAVTTRRRAAANGAEPSTKRQKTVATPDETVQVPSPPRSSSPAPTLPRPRRQSARRSRAQKKSLVVKLELDPSKLSRFNMSTIKPIKVMKSTPATPKATAISNTSNEMQPESAILNASNDNLSPMTTIPLSDPRWTATIIGAVTDENLLEMATKFYELAHRDPSEKAPPKGRPPVWSDSREGLCEVLMYFRSYQGAIYINKGMVHGVMLDGHSTDRDYMDTDTVICRSGGGKKLEKGQYVNSEKETLETQLRAVSNGVHTKNPFVLIVGNNNKLVQFKVQHRYEVVGWYFVTHVWFERDSDGKIMGRYRFSRLQTGEEKWDLPVDHDDEQTRLPAQLGELPPPFVRTCPFCKVEQDQKHTAGWMCLRKECAAFWRFSDGSPPVEEELRYDPRFLKKQTQTMIMAPPNPLRPSTEQRMRSNDSHGGASMNARTGFVCEKCYGCGVRQYWTFWQCENQNCEDYQKKLKIPLPFVPADMMRDSNTVMPIATGTPQPRYNFSKQGMTLALYKSTWHIYAGGYRVDITRLPTPAGYPAFVAHLVTNTHINAEPNIGPDSMFEQLQKDDTVKLRRQQKTSGSFSGESHSGYFSVNYGEKYDYGVPTPTSPLIDAPDVIRTAMARITWAAKVARDEIRSRFGDIGLEDFDAFNEVLLLCYPEAAGISYHDDGEKGVNGTIGTLTLGASANAKIRIHKRVFDGLEGKQFQYTNKPFPGCVNWQARWDRWDQDMARIEVAKREALDARKNGKNTRKGNNGKEEDLMKSAIVKKVLQELGAEIAQSNAAWTKAQRTDDKTVKEQNEYLADWHLQQGDVWLMFGRGVQKFYEHTVSHNGGKIQRYSVTCRQLNLDTTQPLTDEERGILNSFPGPYHTTAPQPGAE